MVPSIMKLEEHANSDILVNPNEDSHLHRVDLEKRGTESPCVFISEKFAFKRPSTRNKRIERIVGKHHGARVSSASEHKPTRPEQSVC